MSGFSQHHGDILRVPDKNRASQNVRFLDIKTVPKLQILNVYLIHLITLNLWNQFKLLARVDYRIWRKPIIFTQLLDRQSKLLPDLGKGIT